MVGGKFRVTLILIVLFLIVSSNYIPAQEIVTVTSSGMGQDSLLGIPRRKMLMSADENDKLWIFHAGTDPDAHYSSDGGDNWTAIGFYNVGDHDSFDIDAYGNIHTGQRGTGGAHSYKRINSSATQAGDYDPAYDDAFAHFSTSTTDAAVLAHGGNVWIFTRENSNSNMYYDLSADNGNAWTYDVLASGINANNRVGAIVIDNTPYALIWELTAGENSLSFYGWNGSTFVEDADFELGLETSNWLTRVFSVTQTDDGNVHVVYWEDTGEDRLRHAYKKKSDSNWSAPVTVDDVSDAGLVSITSYGSDVFAAYLRQDSGFNALTYRRFSSNTTSWGDRVIVDNSGDCRYPVFPKKVNASSDYVPIAWTRGSGLYYHRISVTPTTSTSTTSTSTSTTTSISTSTSTSTSTSSSTSTTSTSTSTTSSSTSTSTIEVINYNWTENFTAFNTTVINASTVNATLVIVTNTTLVDADVNVTSYSGNPTNSSFVVPSLGRYLEITVSQSLAENLNSTVIQMYYTAEELNASNLNESTLAMYWFNTSLSDWQRLNASSMAWVYATDVNASGDFVWANVSHFSTYTIGGESLSSTVGVALTLGWNLISIPLD
ncbi:MAG: hypothetical protein V1921_01295 [Candidatus Altiarchaeota archaeon]